MQPSHSDPSQTAQSRVPSTIVTNPAPRTAPSEAEAEPPLDGHSSENGPQADAARPQASYSKPTDAELACASPSRLPGATDTGTPTAPRDSQDLGTGSIPAPTPFDGSDSLDGAQTGIAAQNWSSTSHGHPRANTNESATTDGRDLMYWQSAYPTASPVSFRDLIHAAVRDVICSSVLPVLNDIQGDIASLRNDLVNHDDRLTDHHDRLCEHDQSVRAAQSASVIERSHSAALTTESLTFIRESLDTLSRRETRLTAGIRRDSGMTRFSDQRTATARIASRTGAHDSSGTPQASASKASALEARFQPPSVRHDHHQVAPEDRALGISALQASKLAPALSTKSVEAPDALTKEPGRPNSIRDNLPQPSGARRRREDDEAITASVTEPLAKKARTLASDTEGKTVVIHGSDV